jgi:2OG-Fe(II) oxygenase superfamily
MKSIVHIPKYLTDTQASDYFDVLAEFLPWTIAQWGKTGRNLPRLVCSYKPESVDAVEELIELIEKAFNVDVTGVWCNYYRSGADYTPPHKDRYGNLDVYTLSLGAARDCVFTKDSDNSKTTYKLQSGDILFFDKEINENYKHSIPKRANAEPRISVVFFAREN